MQCGGEIALQSLGENLRIGDAREDGGHTVDVRGHRFEDQVAQPRQNRQGDDGGDAKDRTCGQARDEDGRRTSAAPLNDAGEPADIGAVDHRHEAAHACDQERDRRTRDRGGDQHPKPVAVGQQAHRDSAQQ